MLFDLKGRRRRVVQGTYLMLAVLMGGGLVFFGIGGDVSGGLFDAFSDRSKSADSGDEIFQKRIDRNEKVVATRPKNAKARKALVRDYYQLAKSKSSENESAAFPPEAQGDLRRADRNWRAWVKLDRKPDGGLAVVALQLYDPNALDKPKLATDAAQMLAKARNDSRSYLNVIQYAVLGKDKQTADLAGKKAIDLAPKDRRKVVKQQVKQLKKLKPSDIAGGGG